MRPSARSRATTIQPPTTTSPTTSWDRPCLPCSRQAQCDVQRTEAHGAARQSNEAHGGEGDAEDLACQAAEQQQTNREQDDSDREPGDSIEPTYVAVEHSNHLLRRCVLLVGRRGRPKGYGEPAAFLRFVQAGVAGPCNARPARGGR